MFTYNSGAFNFSAVIKIMARCKLHEALRHNITPETLLSRNMPLHILPKTSPTRSALRPKHFLQRPILISLVIVCVALNKLSFDFLLRRNARIKKSNFRSYRVCAILMFNGNFINAYDRCPIDIGIYIGPIRPCGSRENKD